MNPQKLKRLNIILFNTASVKQTYRQHWTLRQRHSPPSSSSLFITEGKAAFLGDKRRHRSEEARDKRRLPPVQDSHSRGASTDPPPHTHTQTAVTQKCEQDATQQTQQKHTSGSIKALCNVEQRKQRVGSFRTEMSFP